MNNSHHSLTETSFLILLSLVNPKHGYGIIKEISDWTEGRVNIAAGTMYTALENLKKKEWIECEERIVGRRKVYRITEKGRELLINDAKRMKNNLELYQKHGNSYSQM